MATVILGDLDDFIAPGQACINPLFVTPEDSKRAKEAAAESSNGGSGKAAMQLVLEDDGGPVDAMNAEYGAYIQDFFPATVSIRTAMRHRASPEFIKSRNCVTDDVRSLPRIHRQKATVVLKVVEGEAKPDLIRTTGKQTAKISLDDCLACSGCVTSAETVLITQQSTKKLREAIDSRRYAVIVASISPQARASLADRFGLSATESHARLLSFLRREGVHHVMDSALGADFSLLEAGEEFVQRYRKIPEGVFPPPWLAPGPTVALSSTRRFNVDTGREETTPIGVALSRKADVGRGQRSVRGNGNPGDAGTESIARGPGELLVLTSACPGWVCYAEKTAPEALPCLSSVKSPQQIMGILAKRVLPGAWNLPSSAMNSQGTGGNKNIILNGQEAATGKADSSQSPRRVFHVSIAQCYDKKLEASRKDFRHDDLAGEAEVDLVLTTAEVLELIEERAVAHANANNGNPSVGSEGHPGAAAAAAAVSPGDTVDVAGEFFRSHPACDLSEPLAPGVPAAQAMVTADGLSLFGGVDGERKNGGNSGGYLEYVFRYSALRLFGVDLAGQPLVYREGRNPDFRETTLEVGGQTVLRFAYAYGFRNIQSILAKARRGKCPYQFVEVMACPSGCVNGGGQIKPKREGPREIGQRVGRVSDVLRNHRVPRRPEDNPFVQAVYRELLGCDPGGDAARGWLHTVYHNVPKLELSNPHMTPW